MEARTTTARTLGAVAMLALVLGLWVTSADAQPAGGKGPLARTGDDGVPVQLHLLGRFSEDEHLLGDWTTEGGISLPRTHTIAADSTLLIEHVACMSDTSAERIEIWLEAQATFPGFTSAPRLVALMSEGGAVWPTSHVASQVAHAYLGVATPGGPEIGDTLTLRARRSTAAASGIVDCSVAGRLFE